jgi:hypothetical protein
MIIRHMKRDELTNRSEVMERGGHFLKVTLKFISELVNIALNWRRVQAILWIVISLDKNTD